MYRKAITRKPNKDFTKGITTSDLGKPNYELMLEQHKTYIEILKSLGLKVIELEALNDFPDAHFVEDAAVVVPKIAIITRPGAESRRGEEVSIETELVKYKTIERIKEPGTLDGGDILIVDKKVFIGLSDRTNQSGANQLSDILIKHGYESELIKVEEGLHLKSDVNYIGNNTLLVTEKYFSHPVFENYKKIIVDTNEAYAANSLLINDKLIVPKGFPKTKKRLYQAGFDLIEIEMSESQKMDGGLTCLSLRF
jgi:dimethylargininase